MGGVLCRPNTCRARCRLRVAGANWSKEGWFVPVDYCTLNNQIRPKDPTHPAPEPRCLYGSERDNQSDRSARIGSISEALTAGLRHAPNAVPRATVTAVANVARSVGVTSYN